jgi:antirestriction protein ArdC
MKSTSANAHVRSERQDVYTRVTQKIIVDLEHGVRPWLKPWSAARAGQRVTLPLRHCGTPYQGINILLLWGEAMAKGYLSNRWMTYRQAGEFGGQVRKGEHGSLVVYADRITKTEQNEAGKAIEHEIPYLKGYTVFNVEQIEGLPEIFYERPEVGVTKLELIEAAEEFFAATGAIVRHGGNRAFYSPSLDVIQLPVPEAFRDAESYAATKAHEVTHWTAHPSRLNRTLGKRFGDDAYAAEELVAELGAAFFCATLGITPEPREDHSAYIAHWLRVLKDDRRAIFTAAAHAQRAVDYLVLRPDPTAGPCGRHN